MFDRRYISNGGVNEDKEAAIVVGAFPIPLPIIWGPVLGVFLGLFGRCMTWVWQALDDAHLGVALRAGGLIIHGRFRAAQIDGVITGCNDVVVQVFIGHADGLQLGVLVGGCVAG